MFRSRESWIFGSPDITTLFDDIPHVYTASYSDSYEDFGSAKAHLMDEWVFEKIDVGRLFSIVYMER